MIYSNQLSLDAEALIITASQSSVIRAMKTRLSLKAGYFTMSKPMMWMGKIYHL